MIPTYMSKYLKNIVVVCFFSHLNISLVTFMYFYQIYAQILESQLKS